MHIFIPIPNIYINILRDICGVMVTIVGSRYCNLSSNLVKAVCISHSTNNLRNGLNPILLIPAIDKGRYKTD